MKNFALGETRKKYHLRVILVLDIMMDVTMDKSQVQKFNLMNI